MPTNKLDNNHNEDTSNHTNKNDIPINNANGHKVGRKKNKRYVSPVTPLPGSEPEGQQATTNGDQGSTETLPRLAALPETPRPSVEELDGADEPFSIGVPATEAPTVSLSLNEVKQAAQDAIVDATEPTVPLAKPKAGAQEGASQKQMQGWQSSPRPTESSDAEKAPKKPAKAAQALLERANVSTRYASELKPGDPTQALAEQDDTLYQKNLQRKSYQEVVGPDAWAQRRTRINRILMRKRLHERDYKEMAPRVIAFIAIFILLTSTFLSSGAGAAYAYYTSQLPLLEGIADHSLFQTTHIYDRNGKLLYDLYDHQQDKGRRTYINYTDISPLLVNATVAAEDHSFWTNSGYDVSGIARAALSDLQKNRAAEGGSTITQQLIKKRLFDNEARTYQQKMKEVLLAAGLTQQYTKAQIMEMYLNTVYYGDLNYGVEAAAQDYFDLQAKCNNNVCKPAVAQLDLAQASLLAGLPQSPTYYNPIMNKQSALSRQADVLSQMVDLQMITKQQMLDAQKETAKFNFVSFSNQQQIQAPHFVRYIIDQVLVPLLGADALEDGGYSIYTTLDLDLEKKVEQIVYGHLYQPEYDNYLGSYGPLNITNNVNNGAAVVTNPRTGEILAMDGSAKYDENTPTMNGQFNAAIAPRQPGSSFKPIVYATAFEMGWYPAMIVSDHKTYYPGNVQPPYYSPQNYDGTFHTGFPMTIRNAVANSYNIPAVDTLEFAGIPNIVNMAGRLGLTEITSRPPDTLVPSMAIGSAEVSLLHMTAAYGTFANQGVRMPATSILKIVDNQGKAVYQFDPHVVQGQRVMGADVAYLIDSILSDKTARYHEFSPGNPLELDRPAAAKTGTTDSFRDNWTMGYTPYLAVGVWAGNSDNSKMRNVIGITGAGPIWHDIMEYASQRYNFPVDDFARPANVHQGSVSAITGLQPRPGEPTVTDWFIDGTLPTIQGSNTFQSGGSGGGTSCNNGHHHKNCDNQQNNNQQNGG